MSSRVLFAHLASLEIVNLSLIAADYRSEPGRQCDRCSPCWMRRLSRVESHREHRRLTAPSKHGVPLARIRKENLGVSLAGAESNDLPRLRIGDSLRGGSDQTHAFGRLDSGSPLVQRNRIPAR